MFDAGKYALGTRYPDEQAINFQLHLPPMVSYKYYQLANGLQVIIHEDNTTPLAAVNLLYKVGARDEVESKTGFAHLFEHLMFGGSVHIPSFDEPLQQAGGENNAFTSNDITNYYETLPTQNLETAFWLESDRMRSLAFSPNSLEVQRKVVSEEFKEHYINQPYGDVWHKLRAMCYTTHSYKWPTIGKELKHIEEATLEEVKSFYFRYYRPNNAILVVAGQVTPERVMPLIERYFGDIPAGPPVVRNILPEPPQTAARRQTVHANVPVSCIYKAYHMCGRLDPLYFATDLLSDVLSGGKSGRLYQRLVKDHQLFSEIDAYQTSSLDPGLFVIEGKLLPHVSMEKAEQAIVAELNKVTTELIAEEELQKVKNRVEAQMVFAEVEPLHKAMNLAYSTLLGDPNLMNTDKEKYLQVSAQEIRQAALEVLREENCSTLYYLRSNE